MNEIIIVSRPRLQWLYDQLAAMHAEGAVVLIKDIQPTAADFRVVKNDHRKPLPFRSIPVPKKIGNGKGKR